MAGGESTPKVERTLAVRRLRKGSPCGDATGAAACAGCGPQVASAARFAGPASPVYEASRTRGTVLSAAGHVDGWPRAAPVLKDFVHRVDPSRVFRTRHARGHAADGAGAVRARLLPVEPVPGGERGRRAESGRRSRPWRRRAGSADVGLSVRVRPVPIAAWRPARPLRPASGAGGAARVAPL